MEGVRDMIYYLLTGAVVIAILCLTIALDINADKKRENKKSDVTQKESNNLIYALDIYDALMRVDLSSTYRR